MEIKSTLVGKSGELLDVVYKDIENEIDIGNRKIKAVRAYCFYNDMLVIVYAKDKEIWSPPSGSLEINENIHDAVIREVKEETNMNVILQKIIGYRDVLDPKGTISYTSSVCVVEPYGDFVSDPDGDITEIKFIEPKDYKEYFDYGEIGDHTMKRALELKKEMKS